MRARTITYGTWARVALGYAILVSLQVGLWALLAPRSFYDDFPGFGRVWVSVDGPYNEHLVRDVGALNLALCVVLIAAFIRLTRELLMVAGVSVLVWGVPHALYHLFTRAGLDASDYAISVFGLVAFALVGGGVVAVAAAGAVEPR